MLATNPFLLPGPGRILIRALCRLQARFALRAARSRLDASDIPCGISRNPARPIGFGPLSHRDWRSAVRARLPTTLRSCLRAEHLTESVVTDADQSQADGKNELIITTLSYSKLRIPILLNIMMALALWADGTVTAIAQNADSFDPNAVGGIEGVIAMAVQSDGNIIIGGDFTNVGGMARSNLARLKINGTLDTSFDPEPNGAIYGLAVQADGMILVSGFFTALSGVTRNRIARLNSDGTLDASFNPGVTGDVYGVLVQGDGKIIVWGEFSQLAGQPLNRIGRLNSNGTLDTSFDPGSGANDSIFTVALQADGKMVVSGYHFSNLAGHACNGIGRLNADGSFDTSFNADSVFGVQNDSNLNVVYNLLVQPDQRILLAGAARAWGSIFYGYLLRLKADGSLDSSFQRQSTDDLISAMALQSDGKVLIGGRFVMLSGQSRSNIARINANGSPDNSFNPGATDHHVQGLSVQADGNILVGGNFTTLAGQPRNYIGRLTNMGMVQQSFAVNAKGTALTWQRSGPGPELQQVTFEQSNDGSNYTFLGNCKYSRGGWQLAGLSVPAVQTFYLRARGQAVGGYFSASSGLIEQIAQIYWVPPPAVFLDNGALRYTFSGTSNTSFSVFATTNLNLVSSNWILLGPAAYLGNGYCQYADLAATNFPQRFYRGVGQ